jgi:tRNA(fMet)-specific endonuclease VapC
MSHLCLDTNTYTALLAGNARAVAVIASARNVWMPAPVLGELRAGFAKGSRVAANELILQEFLASPHVQTIAIDEAATRCYARIFDQLRRAGRPIPTNDLWIGACVMNVGYPLFTLDQHFAAIDGIEVVH